MICSVGVPSFLIRSTVGSVFGSLLTEDVTDRYYAKFDEILRTVPRGTSLALLA